MTRVLGRSPCLARPPPNAHTTPPSFPRFHPAPLHRDFSLSTAKLPISTRMITAHSDLYSAESRSSGFGRRTASAPASLCYITSTGWKVNEAVVSLSALKLFPAELFWLRLCALTSRCEVLQKTSGWEDFRGSVLLFFHTLHHMLLFF